MDSRQARDDLKAIRQIMNSARQASGREAGWFLILWGLIWLIGFCGSQFLRGEVSGWLWTILNTLGGLLSIWLGVRMGRQVGEPSLLWRIILMWWLALAFFAALVIWLFDLHELNQHVLVIVLTVALGYMQFGLFTHWSISVIGFVLGALAVAAAAWLPGILSLVMGFAGGGVLIGGGAWMLRVTRKEEVA